MRSLKFTIMGEVNTQITVTEQADGTLLFETQVLGSGSLGDLRGLFFDVADPSKLGAVSVSGDDVTEVRVGDDSIDTVGQDNNVKGEVSKESGKFDVGIEFGTPGMSTDDIQSTSFTLSGLMIDDISPQDFALRYTSTGTEGDRTGSAKILGQSTAAPDAVADEFTTDEDTALAGANLLGNDTDADTLTVNLVNGESTLLGTPFTVTTAGGRTAEVTVAADGTLSFTPDDDFDTLGEFESDSFEFTYGITDSNGGADTSAKVTVTIDGLNDAPVVVADFYSTDEDTALNVGEAASVLSNDSDVEGDALTVTEVNGYATDVGSTITLASGALLTLNADGTFGYDPNGQFESLNASESATDSFDYTVSDGNGGTATATATVTIGGVDDVATKQSPGRILLSGRQMTTTLEAQLESKGFQADIVASNQLQNTDLSGYQGVWLSWTTVFDNSTGNLDDNLRSFVDSGGNVLAEVYGSNADELLTDDAFVFGPGTDSVGIVDGSFKTLTDGLTDAAMSGWGSSAHSSFANLGTSFTGVMTNEVTSATDWVTIAKESGDGNIVLTGLDPSYHAQYGVVNPGAIEFVENAMLLA